MCRQKQNPNFIQRRNKGPEFEQHYYKKTAPFLTMLSIAIAMVFTIALQYCTKADEFGLHEFFFGLLLGLITAVVMIVMTCPKWEHYS